MIPPTATSCRPARHAHRLGRRRRVQVRPRAPRRSHRSRPPPARASTPPRLRCPRSAVASADPIKRGLSTVVTAPAIPAPPPMNQGDKGTFARPSRSGNRRNAELGLLAFAMVLVGAYAAASEAGLAGRVTAGFLGPVFALGALFLVAHLVIRWLAPYADPVLLP